MKLAALDVGIVSALLLSVVSLKRDPLDKPNIIVCQNVVT
jgi:hypothetical protein